MQESKVIAEVTGQDFDEEVLKSRLPVFACFTSSWCRSCFALCLVTDDLAKEYGKRIKFVRINVEENPELAVRYHITPLPAVLISHNSQLVKRLLGFRYKRKLREMLNKVIVKKKRSAERGYPGGAGHRS